MRKKRVRLKKKVRLKEKGGRQEGKIACRAALSLRSL